MYIIIGKYNEGIIFYLRLEEYYKYLQLFEISNDGIYNLIWLDIYGYMDSIYNVWGGVLQKRYCEIQWMVCVVRYFFFDMIGEIWIFNKILVKVIFI